MSTQDGDECDRSSSISACVVVFPKSNERIDASGSDYCSLPCHGYWWGIDVQSGNRTGV